MSSGARQSRQPRRRPAARGRTPLTADEIWQLDAAFIRAFRTIHELRQELPAARHIKSPPLPSIYSESLVIAAAPRLFGPGWTGRYGGTVCDVIIENVGGEVKRVEVKATGEHAFQEFKTKDLQADLLVWVRFGRRFNVGHGPIEIAILANPSQFIPNSCRLDSTRFRRRVGESEHLKLLSFDSLDSLLHGSSPLV